MAAENNKDQSQTATKHWREHDTEDFLAALLADANIRRILVAVDKSEGARKAFNCALRDVANRPTDELHLFTAVSGDAYFNVTQGESTLDEFKEECDKLKITVKGHVAVGGDARDQLVNFANKLNPNVLVIGSRGLGSIKRALLGSMSTYAIHHCECPVLVVK